MPDCYLLSYDHGGLVLWGYDHFVQHLRTTLGWLQRHPKLKMGLDNEAWMYDWLAANQPAVLAEIRGALQRFPGRFAIGTCTYGQPLAAFLLEESNVRQIALGVAATRQHLGYDITIYNFSEHAAFAQLPQVLRLLGFQGALMRTHFYMYGYCPGYDLPIAWWRGPDGSQIACVPTYPHEERQEPNHRAQPPGPFGLTTEDNWILTRWPGESPTSLDDFRQRFAGIRPLLASRIDDSGLKREALVSATDARDEFEWATLEDVFAKFPKPTRTIAPQSEDFGVRMPWGYRGNELFDLYRQAEIAVLTAERLLARVAAGGHESPGRGHPKLLDPAAQAQIEPQLQQAWKDLLVGQHHDAQITQPAGALGRQRLLASLERSTGITRGLLAAQADERQNPEDFIAFNPLPWPRTEASAVLPDGTALPAPVSAPALGIAPLRVTVDAFTPVPATQPDADLTFETQAYRVQIDRRGGIASLTTRAGDALLRPGTRSGTLAAVIDAKPCESAGVVALARGAAGYQVTERGKVGPLPYTIRWLFPATGRRIDCHIQVRFNNEVVGAPAGANRWDSRHSFTHEQKLRVGFHPAVDSAKAFGIYDVPFGVATTKRPYVEGNYWTALADEAGGLLVANRGTMGSAREESGAFAVPLAFSTPYVWGTEALCGDRHWALGLLPWRGDWRAAHLHRQALEFAFPIVAVPGTLAQPSADYLRLDSPDVHLTAFYLDGPHAYARWCNGSDRPQALALPAALMSVDLRHHDLGARGPGVTLEPWEIVTLRVW